MHQKQSLKSKIFWGSMPPDPPSVHVLMHMYTQGFAPPTFFINTHFDPPFDQFLNEGLTRVGEHMSPATCGWLKKGLVGTEWAISLLLCTKQLGKNSFHLVQTQCLAL